VRRYAYRGYLQNMDIKVVKCKQEKHRLRECYKNLFFNKKYDGWNDEFDQSFDQYSEWFSLINKDVFCRVTYKNNNLVPIDTGYKSLIPNNSKACEINNFLYRDKTDGINLINQVIRRLEQKGITQIYCIVDKDFNKAYKFNTDLFGFRYINKSFPYTSVLKKDTNSPITWDILLKEKTQNGFTYA